MNHKAFRATDERSRHLRNTASNLLRWFLLGVAFIFLLTGLFALNEVMNFQRRVAELVSDGNRARQVLVTLHERLTSVDEPQPDQEDRRLPFAVMAVQLGSVESAVEDLDGFGWGTDGAETPPSTTDPAGDGGDQEDAERVENQYSAATSKLAADLGELRNLLSEEGPAPEVVASIEDLRAEVAQIELVGTVALKGLLDRLEQSVNFQPPAEDGARKLLIEEVEKTQDQLTSNGSILAEPVLKNSPDFGVALADMKRRLSGLEDKLADNYGDDFRIAETYASELNQLQTLAKGLQRFEPSIYRPAQGDGELEDSEAAAQYEQTVGELSGALDRLKRRLEPETRLVQVGSIIARGDDDPEAAAYKAELISHDFDALARFNTKLSLFTWMGVDPRVVATLSADSLTLLFVMMIGAIGSLIYVAQYNLKPLIQGHNLTDPPDRGLLYVIFRIFFGVVMALAVYLLVKAGQLAFGGAAGASAGDEINRPILAVVGLLAGLLAWHALNAIESKGAAWFGAQTRKDLWATGLDHALRQAEREFSELAFHIGRSVEQIERWLTFSDKVTPEMQDRIRTFLDRPLEELFSDTEPKNKPAGRPMWATGLGEILEDRSRTLDLAAVAELLGEHDVERIRRWRDLELQVSPPMQWRLVEALQVRHSDLFDATKQLQPAWTHSLRATKRTEQRRIADLVTLVGIDAQSLYAWQEAEKPVPPKWQNPLSAALKAPWTQLFDPVKPGPAEFLVLSQLERRMQAAGKTEQELAEAIDVNVERVQAWSRGEVVFRPTARAIAKALGIEEQDLQTLLENKPPTSP